MSSHVNSPPVTWSVEAALKVVWMVTLLDVFTLEVMGEKGCMEP